jgi:EAL domain-containing protein (putative c-di-GMP-specific phosphodiesterase class I)
MLAMRSFTGGGLWASLPRARGRGLMRSRPGGNAETAATFVEASREFDQIIAQRTLPTVFQPVVELESGHTVGYEALIRPPNRSLFDSPQALLDMAYRTDRVVEFDWLARASACRAIAQAELPADQLVFFNIEPIALISDCPPDLWPDIERIFRAFPVILEVTERSLDRDPRSLMEGIQRQWPMVSGFAVDDVGSTALTLSLVPLISPHVIKLDMRIVQSGLTADVIGVLDLAYEEAERTEALILTEGVETALQAELARSIGAHLGQGYHCGRPADLSHNRPPAVASVRLPEHTLPNLATPFDALQGRRTSRAGSDVLMALTEQVQTGGAELRGPSVLMCHLPHPALLTPEQHDRLAAIGRRGVFTAVIGPGIPADPGQGIRGVGSSQSDLYGQWAIIALGPSVAAALLAKAANEEETEYDFALIHDRERVIAAAHSLFRRIGPLA